LHDEMHTMIATQVSETAVGGCAIAWGDEGVLAVQLPDASDAATCARLLRGYLPAAESAALPTGGRAPPAFIQSAIAGITGLLSGQPLDLLDIVLDMRRIPPFHQRVYALARQIGPGRTLTYGAVAQALGEPGAARAVGQALGSNPFVIVVPCHRVLAADGRAGGFSAPGGTRTKLQLLTIEGAFSQPARPGDTMPLF